MTLSFVQACLNGGRTRAEHAAIPITPEDLAADARAVAAAGARAIHLHPRDAAGAETLEPDAVAAALDAVRAAAPALSVGIGTGAWIAPGGLARLERIARWGVLPDYASVNLKEPDAPETIARLERLGVGVEAGLWSAADARRFLAEIAPERCLRILIEVTLEAPDAARAEARAIRDLLGAAGVDRPILLHGEGGSVWACVAEAARWGVATRVGFEDGLTSPNGAVAPDNAALIRAAMAYA